MSSRRSDIIVCLLLIMATLVPFGQMASHDFINYDDDTYITKNARVQDGLTGKTVNWA